MSKKITIVGTGMDGINTITAEGLTAVNSADAIIGAERVLEPFLNTGKQIFTSYKTEEISVMS